MNRPEMIYNIVLCLLKIGRLRRAMDYIKKLLKICPQKYADGVLSL